MRKTFKNSGFTLIETLVVVFVFAVIASGVIMLVSSVLVNSQKQETQIFNASQARRLSFVLMEELRELTTSNTGSYPISEAGAQQLTFYSNVDGGTDVERLRYFIQGETLRRGFLKPTGSPLTYNVANEVISTIQRDVANTGSDPLFYYYDGTYTGVVDNFLAQPVDVTEPRYIKLNLRVYNKAGMANTSYYTISTAAALRNLKTNLDE